MKRPQTLILLVIFCCAKTFAQQNDRCGAVHTNGIVWPNGQSNTNFVSGRAVVNIPVVVHVVWNKTEENITDEQIQSQIEVLNKDFNAENIEIEEVPIIFQAVIANVDFHFCLASKDPDGNSTSGITRTFTNNNLGMGGTTAIHHSAQGGHDAWAPDKYLNIWVSKFSGGLGGTATFPGEGPDDEQGVEVSYKQFGTIGTAADAPYHLGRTCTHEIGHYFNLEHVWGPSINSCCDEDDGVADTPESCEDYLNECPSGNVFSCLLPDMWMNFMNYTDDACMAMFSQGQKLRMYEALNEFRPGLLTSDGCMALAVNEAENQHQLVWYTSSGSGTLGFEVKTPLNTALELRLINALGQTLYSAMAPSNTFVTLNGQQLAKGFYVLSATHQKTQIASRVVIF